MTKSLQNSSGKACIKAIFSVMLLLTLLGCNSRTGPANSSPTATQANNPGTPTLHASTPTATATPTATQVSLNQPTATSDLNCTYSQYYWQNNPSQWLSENIVIGRLTYTKSDALAIFNSQETDVTVEVLKQFFSAALNILKGADPSDIENDIVAVSRWINENPLNSDLSESERATAESLRQSLQDYNSGVTGPGACPDEPSTPTPTITPTPTPTPTNTPRPALPGSRSTPTATKERNEPPPKRPTDTPEPQPTELPPPPPPTQAPPPTQPPPPPTEEPTPTSPPPPPPTSSSDQPFVGIWGAKP
jgi:hypothetical protein